MPARTWIFQANPETYDARRALQDLHELHWSVKQHASEIHAGDRVYIWESGPGGGLVAETVVVSEPGMHAESEAEQRYYLKPTTNPSTNSVRLRLVTSWDSPAIVLKDLKADPVLQQTKLCKMPQGTNFPVSEEEVLVIEQLLTPKPSFPAIIQRYFEERVVLTSSEKGALYCIDSVDETGFMVRRLTANDPARVTFALHNQRLAELKTSGSQSVKDFENTVAIRAGLLQSSDLGLSADRTSVVLLTDEAVALDNFVKILSALNVDRSTGSPKLYKPMLLACAIEAIGEGAVSDHRFRFDDLLPRFLAKAEALGVEAGADQAALAFFHLTNDLIWNLAYFDVEQRFEAATPGVIRERVQHAVLKEPYRWLLRKCANRQHILDEIAKTWWPQAKEHNVGVSFWWVNQGQTYEKEREAGLLWAPQRNKSSSTNFHWDNVGKIKKGDIVFHYANGSLVAVSRASADGGPGAKPPKLGGDWQEAGWTVQTSYSELVSPIPLANVAKSIRKWGPEKYGPINRTDGANQGYLFALTPGAARIIAEQLDLSQLPPAIASILDSLLKNQWEAFIYWAKRFWSDPKIRESERSYKIEIGSDLAAVNGIVQAGGDWLTPLRKAFQGDNNLTDYRSHDDFLKWCQAETESAQQLLKSVWDPTINDADAVAMALSQLPKDAVSGVGIRNNIISFLAMEREPTRCTIYKSNPFDLGCRLTAFPAFFRVEEQKYYAHALSFLDRILHEAAARGLQLEDRLDAQGVLWCVTKYPPPESWSDEDKIAFLAFRDGVEPVKDDDDPIDPLQKLADDLYLDVEFIEEIKLLLESKSQVIFYGPPGTGKTYVAKALARHLAAPGGSVEIVQFHPSYAYEDFVEGYRPHTENGQPVFRLARGPLRRLAKKSGQES